MKSEFLKLAGVKSEKAFYKKYPNEAAFFKAHPQAKKMINGGVQNKGQLKKLDDLTNFTNYNELPKGELGLDFLSKGSNFMGDISKLSGGIDKIAGKAVPFVGGATDIIGGISALAEEKKARKQAKQDSRLTGVMAQAAESRPEPIQRQYVRPEDVMVQPDQIFPSYGTGTNILAAEYGATIGGNPTEIMNTYDPETLYSDLGYEPLEDSSEVKQYYAGGNLPKAQDGLQAFTKAGGADLLNNIATRVGTGKKTASGSSQLGKGIGSIAGNILLPGVGGVIGGAFGSMVGGLFGRGKQKELENLQKETQTNTDRITGQQFAQGVQNQYSTFMEDGGWVSHDWQPQVIAKFGEYDVDDLFTPDKTMDTLRTGGNIRQNQMAMGGDLKVYRGEAEPMSYNPYLPDGGETIMFRGPSHENGGMPIEYGESPVEVEGGEPAVKLKDGGNKESLVVFGNLIEPDSKRKFKNVVADIAKKEARQNKILDKSVDELDQLDTLTPFDKLKMGSLEANLKGANMKLKTYADEKMDLAAKQSAINETAEEFGLEADALAKGKFKKAKLGATVKKAQDGTVEQFKDNRALIDLFEKAKGQKSGKDVLNFQKEFVKTYPDASNFIMKDFGQTNYAKSNKIGKGDPLGNIDGKMGPITEAFGKFIKSDNLYDLDPISNIQIPTSSPSTPEIKPVSAKYFDDYFKSQRTKNDGSESNFDSLINIGNQILPLIRPSDAEGLDIRQITPELSALTDQEQPVYAQKFTPDLLTPFDVVDPQAQLNAVDAQINSAMRLSRNDPAAQAIIMAQAAEMKNKIFSDAQQANRANYLSTINRNVEKLDDAELKNLGILDQQQVRQAQARSNTVATKRAAQQSIADKYVQNKAEQQKIQLYENLYNYRFGKNNVAQNMNPLVDFEAMLSNASPQELNKMLESINKKSSSTKTDKTKSTKESRNGSIVKALKSL